MISPAFAQQAGAAANQGGGMTQIVFLLAMFAILWFLMIRPQMKKAKEHKAMLAALQKGDEVVTQGGVTGRLTKLGDNYVSVEIADGVEVQLQKIAVSVVLPKGTLKNL